MKQFSFSYGPRFFRINWLIRCMAVFFIITLASSLVSLPFASKKAKSVILNTVEEESKSNSANSLEEHSSGKKFSVHSLEYDSAMSQLQGNGQDYPVITAISILSSNHSRKVIQPPDFNI